MNQTEVEYSSVIPGARWGDGTPFKMKLDEGSNLVQNYIKDQPCSDGYFWFFAYGEDRKSYKLSPPYVSLRAAILDSQKFLNEENIELPMLSLNTESYCGEKWSLWKTKNGSEVPPHLRKS